MSTPANMAVSFQKFLAKNGMTPMCSPILILRSQTFILFPLMKKVLKGKSFADVEEGKQKMAETPKGIKIYMFKNCFEQWEKYLNKCAHQMESTLKVI